MKPFDLEAAKNGAKVCTQEGQEVRILCFNRDSESFPIVALVRDSDGTENVKTYSNGGLREGFENRTDLIMAPVKRKGYLVITMPDGGVVSAFNVEEHAQVFASYGGSRKVVEVEWEV